MKMKAGWWAPGKVCSSQICASLLTMGTSFIQEVAEVEEGVSGGQELEELLLETTDTQG